MMRAKTTYGLNDLTAVEYAVLRSLVRKQVMAAHRAGSSREINGLPVSVLKTIARKLKIGVFWDDEASDGA